MIPPLLCLAGVVFYTITKLEVNYQLANVLPEEDPTMVTYKSYQDDFGRPPQSLVLGVRDKRVFQLDDFLTFRQAVDEIEKVTGVQQLLSFVKPPQLIRDEKNEKMTLRPLFSPLPTTQQDLDSMRQVFLDNPLYTGQLHNPTTGAMLTNLVFEDAIFFTKQGDQAIEEVFSIVEKVKKQTGLQIDYSGLAYFRYLSRTNLDREVRIFVAILSGFSFILLLLVFRSFYDIIPAIFLLLLCPPLTVSFVVWFGYKIGMLFTLIMPITIIVCVTNYVYFANCYREAWQRFGRWRSIVHATEKMGRMLFFANFTTAVGFWGLAIVDNPSIREFGIITGLGVMISFALSMVVLPLAFSLIPMTFAKEAGWLSRNVQGFLTWVESLVFRHPKRIIVVISGIIVLSLFGLFRIQPVSFLSDYLSLDSRAKRGLKFVEDNFGGILPLEIVVDTQKKKGVYRIKNMERIAAIQTFLNNHPQCAASLSFVNFLKAGTQAFYHGDPAFYKVPSSANFPFIHRYLSTVDWTASRDHERYIDKNAQKYRISTRMKDVGSHRLSYLINHEIKPQIDALLQDTSMQSVVTGTSTLLIRRNDYLVGSFVQSMLLAFLVVAISISILLRRATFVYVSLLTNVIPLFIITGLIGYVSLKVTPSMILTFTISFGIAVDNSIHFLSHYSRERVRLMDTKKALSHAIRTVGPNMIQTTIILFFSFGFFVLSSFDSITYFGLLISFTLIFTIISNLVFLPALLILGLDKPVPYNKIAKGS